MLSLKFADIKMCLSSEFARLYSKGGTKVHAQKGCVVHAVPFAAEKRMQVTFAMVFRTPICILLKALAALIAKLHAASKKGINGESE